MRASAISRRSWLAAIVAAAAGIAALLVPRDGLFAQGVPVYRPTDIAIFAFAAIAALAAAVVLAPIERSIPVPGPLSRIDKAGLSAGSVIVLLMVLILLFLPGVLPGIVFEDGPLEILQAVVLFYAAFILARAAIARWDEDRRRATVLAAFAALLALVALEEVSWFQRILRFDTPDWLFEVNQQQEVNFHNLATGHSEYIYYYGVFALFVMSRYLRVLRSPTIDAYLPALPVFALGALSTGINYEMWPGAIAVLALALALGLTATVARVAAERGDSRRASWLLGIIALTVASQIVLVVLGTRMHGIQNNDEIRETVIAIGLALYARHLAVTARPTG